MSKNLSRKGSTPTPMRKPHPHFNTSKNVPKRLLDSPIRKSDLFATVEKGLGRYFKGGRLGGVRLKGTKRKVKETDIEHKLCGTCEHCFQVSTIQKYRI